MWNGAPVLEHRVDLRERLRERLDGRETRRRRSRACARSRARAAPSRAAARSRPRRRPSRARARAPSPRSRTAPSRSLRLEPLAQLAELLADRVDRLLARAAEQEPGVEDDELGARRLRDPGRVVEHPDRHVQLLAALGVAHEAGDRRVHREHDPVLARELAEARARSRSPSRTGPRSRSRRRCSRARAARRPRPRGSRARAPVPGPKCRACSHRRGSLRHVRPIRSLRSPHVRAARHASTCSSSTSTSASPTSGARPPGSSEWSLEVVAAFMRAAYGKGYCDALTEERPGSLCADHGYRVPSAETLSAPTPDAASSTRRPRALARLDRGGPSDAAARRRLVVALAVAGLLAVFLIYTALGGGSTPRCSRATSRATTGTVSLTGKVVGPVAGDAHDRRRPPLRAPQHQGREPDRPDRLPRLGARPVQGRPRRQPDRSARGRRIRRDRDDDEVPEQVHLDRTTPALDG